MRDGGTGQPEAGRNLTYQQQKSTRFCTPGTATIGQARVDVVRALCQGYSLNGCFAVIERQAGMSELETAQQHLVEALTRLETAVTRRLIRAPSGEADDSQAFEHLTAERADLARDVNVLRSECDRLSAALSAIERDHRNLREVTSDIAQRIDGSIAEIDRLLGG
jgi:NAD-specific glutamate dehydrogenase